MCDQAKNLLSSKSISYSEVIIDYGQQKIDGKQYISRDEFMSFFPTVRSLPLVTQEETKAAMSFAELKKLLTETAEI